MADVFISYARADRQKVEKLAAALEAHGLSVWWDRFIAGGDEFSKNIERELAAAKTVVVAWSKDGNESRWVKDEAALAADAKKLVPITLDGVEPPLGFRQFQLVDCARWSGAAHAPEMEALAAAMRLRLGAPETQAAAPGLTPRRIGLGPPKAFLYAGLAIAALVAAGAAVLLLQRPPGEDPQAPAATAESPAVAAEEQTPQASERSVAVLPFVALSSGPDDGYFADGLTEEIINSLTTLPDLLVTARTSAFHFKGKDEPIPEIAKKLGVAHVVEGSVRRSGDRLRITAQLIRASDGFHLWSENYERELDDLFAVQSEIAESVARALGVLLDEGMRETMRKLGVGDVEAFLAYRRASDLYVKAHTDGLLIPTLALAEADYARAVARKPDFAQALIDSTDLYSHILMDAEADADLPMSRDEAQRRLSAALEAAYRARSDGARFTIRAERTFLSSDWSNFGRQIDHALAEWEKCWSGVWIHAAAPVFGRGEAMHARNREFVECEPKAGVLPLYSALFLGRPDEALALAEEIEGRFGRDESAEQGQFMAHLMQGDFAAAERNMPVDQEQRWRFLLAAARGDKVSLKNASAAALRDEGPRIRLMIHALSGNREEANAAAAKIDESPLGASILVRATYDCLCGAPFDVAATPNFARQLNEGDLPWPPASPIRWPLKDW